MSKQAIYIFSGNQPETAILKGLRDAGCQVAQIKNISDTMAVIQQVGENALLVAKAQAGAIALLSLLQEQHGAIPPVIMFDKSGRDIHTVIRALQLGVREYLLSTECAAAAT